MKRQFVRDIQAGRPVDERFVLAEKTLLQKKDGDNYLNVVLADRTGRIKGVVWDQVESIAAAVNAGEVVQVRATAGEYRGALQLVVREMSPVAVGPTEMVEFLPATPRDVDRMFQRLVSLSETLAPAYFRALFQILWQDDQFVEKFKAAPAAKKMHHAYLGGLLEHTLSMAVLADKIAEHYSGVDRDLLVAGALLHDIGKIDEFRYDSQIDYSDEGRLLNHIVIGVRMVDEKIRNIADFPSEQALLLKHMLVSHHGSRELGSPEPPKTIEAVLLNFIDDIDSKVQGIREFMGKEDSDQSWTSFHRLLERHFYRGKKV